LGHGKGKKSAEKRRRSQKETQRGESKPTRAVREYWVLGGPMRPLGKERMAKGWGGRKLKVTQG